MIRFQEIQAPVCAGEPNNFRQACRDGVEQAKLDGVEPMVRRGVDQYAMRLVFQNIFMFIFAPPPPILEYGNTGYL